MAVAMVLVSIGLFGFPLCLLLAVFWRGRRKALLGGAAASAFALLLAFPLIEAFGPPAVPQAGEVQASVPALAAPDTEGAPADSCRRDVGCFAESHLLSATFACQPRVERAAKYAHEWTDGWLEPKFSAYRWRSIDSGVVTYLGDAVRYQNGYGAWMNMVYECDYDSAAEAVLDLRVSRGRLPD